MSSVGEEFPKEQARVRELLAEYRKLPPQSGWFGVAMLEATLKEADEAAISGDVVRILRAYEALKGCA